MVISMYTSIEKEKMRRKGGLNCGKKVQFLAFQGIVSPLFTQVPVDVSICVHSLSICSLKLTPSAPFFQGTPFTYIEHSMDCGTAEEEIALTV